MGTIRFPVKSVPTITTVSGFPASCANGAISGVSGAIFTSCPNSVASCCAASREYACTGS